MLSGLVGPAAEHPTLQSRGPLETPGPEAWVSGQLVLETGRGAGPEGASPATGVTKATFR